MEVRTCRDADSLVLVLSAPASHAPESHVGRHSMSQIRDQQYGKRTITPMRIAAAMTNE
jgi:hypothetical protein